MNKIIFLFVLIFLAGCSLNKNSKFWSTSEILNEDKNNINTSKSEEILKKSLVYKKEFNQNLKIKVEGNFNTNKQIDYLIIFDMLFHAYNTNYLNQIIQK